MAKYFYLRDNKPVLAKHMITFSYNSASEFEEELSEFHYKNSDIFCYSDESFDSAKEIVETLGVEFTTTTLYWPEVVTNVILEKTYEDEKEVQNDMVIVSGELEAEVGEEFTVLICAPSFVNEGKLKVIMSTYDTINDMWRENTPIEYDLEEDGTTELKYSFGREGEYKFTINTEDIGTTDEYVITIVPSATPQPKPVEIGEVVETLKTQLNEFVEKQTFTADDIYKAVVVEDVTLDELKKLKIDQLNYWCNTTILGGFTSDALGSVHKYDLDYEAQINMSGIMNAINAGLVGETVEWKTDKGTLPHTVAQMKKVYMDGLIFKQVLIAKYWTLKTSVEALTVKEDVTLINWE